MTTVARSVGKPGRQFFNARLQTGGVLARAVFAHRGPVTRAWAPVPDDVDPAILAGFDDGGVTSFAGMMAWLATHLAAPRLRGEATLLVLEDGWFTPADIPNAGTRPTLALAEPDALLYALACEAVTEATLHALFRLTGSFEISGFVLRDAGTIRPGLPAAELALVVTEAFVTAFDRDGIVAGDWAGTDPP